MRRKLNSETPNARRARRRAAVATPLLAAVFAFAAAQKPPATSVTANESSLPSGEAVIEKYLEATGGRDKYEAVKTRVTKATLEIPGQGVTMALTIYHARPDRMRVKAEIPKVGTLESGVFDGVAWEISPMTGPRVKDGQEAKDALRDARFDKWTSWKETFASLDCTGEIEVEGKPCYKVLATPIDGKPQTLYFEKESHLLRRIESALETQMGELTMTTFLHDYQPFGGILMPKTARSVLMTQERVLTTESVEVNGALPEGTFALPEPIRALLAKEPKAGSPQP